MKKEDIIKSGEDFNKILNYNHKVSNNEFIIFYVPKDEQKPKFGIIAPKKLGNAVLRNKCKRRLRMGLVNSPYSRRVMNYAEDFKKERND